MKNSIRALLSIAIAAVAVSACNQQSLVSPHPAITNISVADAYKLYNENLTNMSFIVLDVRKPDEFSGGHITGAVNLNYQDPLFQQNAAALDKSKVYLVYCKAGTRSAKASEAMANMGFKKIYNMTGGFDSWSASGYPSEK
ncbi:MAG: hypothetical protein A2Y33_15660 [Spirochaetes bacterium GWF1_51_8]|nr:MAG: hypothetical protein A2Y33_15660 [Spirochaetes bacterium GWF1_51_8]